jgi:C4-dicarboxylate-specific signal transduction histidine kinase
MASDSRLKRLLPEDGELSLRSQLLAGLGVLLLVALLAEILAALVWLPADWSPAALLAAFFGLAVLLVGILLLFSHLLLERLLIEPLEGMVEDAERIAEGRHGHRMEAEGPLELRRLGQSVNEMAEQLIRHQEELAENIRSLDEVNRELTDARDELVRAEKLASVGRLAAGLAHEIGNPLNAITTYVEIGRRRTGGEPDWLVGIAEEAERIDRIVGGLLDYASPGSGPTVDVDVNEVVGETVELLGRQGRLDGAQLRRELEEALPRVRVNPFHLQQVLVNLLINACDAIQETGARGTIVITTRTETAEGLPADRPRPRRADDPEEVDYSHIRRFNAPSSEVRRHSFREGDRLVTVAVEDDGVGLPGGEVERVFDPFFTTKDPGKGTGLGLSVSARLVAMMGGTVEASNRDEGGCVFRVKLPVTNDREDG